MADGDVFFGKSTPRIDGDAKVTGKAKYAAEYTTDGLLQGYVVSSRITKGRIVGVDTSRAMAIAGVVKVYTHLDAPKESHNDKKWQDEVGPPGAPFRPLQNDRVLYANQPVALVVAETFEAARDAAALVDIVYAEEEHITDLDAVKGQSYEPPKKRDGITPPPKPRGDADSAFQGAPVKFSENYRVAIEHHNPMEPFATTVIVGDDGVYTVYDKTQGPQNVQKYLVGGFGLNKHKVKVETPFMGGGFGSGLRPQYQVFLAMLVATDLERSVRVTMTRDQMFTFVYRPETLQAVTLGADAQGKLLSIRHHATAGTSHFEDHQEVVVNWSGLLYDCANVKLTYELAKIDTYTPGDMRAPGAVLGVYAIESAMDELAHRLKIDPIELRLRNYAEKDENEGKEFTSKALREAFKQGAERFGWSGRNPEPRSMRDGRELVGWGMATAVWEAQVTKCEVELALTPDGRCKVTSGFPDIGTGQYTTLAVAAADATGLRIDQIDVRIGGSDLPTGAVSGGSWTAASSASAVLDAGETLKTELLKMAGKIAGSPLKGAKPEFVTLENGRIFLKAEPAAGHTLDEVVQASGHDRIVAKGKAAPDQKIKAKYSSYTHSAVFCEVKVDEELGQVRVTRIVNAVAAGRIINPKTARSQILGGVVMALGAALSEETFLDNALGRFMNHNLAEYHVPVNADVEKIEVIFVDERDDKTSPVGAKGLGEIGIVGTPAAIANAIFHATGQRVRDLPITLDKVLGLSVPPA